MPITREKRKKKKNTKSYITLVEGVAEAFYYWEVRRGQVL